MAVALYAGSFDPIHLGHLDVIQRAAGIYESVVVAVVANPNKAVGLFRPEDRLRLVNEATRDLPNVSSAHFHGLTVDLARSVGATVLVRAAHKERDNEVAMAATNLDLAGIPTAFVAASPDTLLISSSMVRQLVEAGRLAVAQELVPTCVRGPLASVSSAPAP